MPIIFRISVQGFATHCSDETVKGAYTAGTTHGGTGCFGSLRQGASWGIL